MATKRRKKRQRVCQPLRGGYSRRQDRSGNEEKSIPCLGQVWPRARGASAYRRSGDHQTHAQAFLCLFVAKKIRIRSRTKRRPPKSSAAQPQPKEQRELGKKMQGKKMKPGCVRLHSLLPIFLPSIFLPPDWNPPRAMHRHCHHAVPTKRHPPMNSPSPDHQGRSTREKQAASPPTPILEKRSRGGAEPRRSSHCSPPLRVKIRPFPCIPYVPWAKGLEGLKISWIRMHARKQHRRR
jgi:hypothetical protein